MPDQIVEITNPGHWLTKSRGFLKVQLKGEVIGQVPLDDIVAVLISVPGCSISTVLIDYLSQNNIPAVICGQNFLPSSLILPLQGYNRQFTIMRAQTKQSEPRRKKAWQKIVQSKIQNQADLLKIANKSESQQLLRLVKKVRSGDPENCEAQAARIYWKSLLGNDFTRDKKATDLNAAFNYIYTVVRACVVRGIVSAGLHPSFSIHHRNPQNPLNLADDLIEPFRPIADYVVFSKISEPFKEITTEIKTTLSSIINLLIPIQNEMSPLSVAAVKMCRGYANYCLKESEDLPLPKVPDALEIGAL